MSKRVHTEDPVELTVRTCHWCGRRYSYPKGAKSDGCPHCAPTLFEPPRPVQK